MIVSRTVVLTLVLIFLCACGVKSYQDQRGPKCLGPVCMIWNEKFCKDAESFFEKYGVGVADEGKFPAYWYIENDVYVYIGRYHGENRPIETIVVSKYPYYSEHALPPKQSFGPLVTESGIGIGSTYQEVIDAYGKPDDVYTDIKSVSGPVLAEMWPVDRKDVVIARYENVSGELDYGPWSLFFFEKDKLIAIELSNAL